MADPQPPDLPADATVERPSESTVYDPDQSLWSVRRAQYADRV